MEMSMSTPLNQLPSLSMPDSQAPPVQQQGHDQLVDDILKEFDEPPQQQSNIDTEIMGYAFDSSQIPPPKMNKNFLDASESKKSLKQDSDGQSGDSTEFMDYTETKVEWILNMAKKPIVVFIITFLLSLPQFNRFLFGLVPSCLLESGQVNIFGVLLKSVIGMILFILASIVW